MLKWENITIDQFQRIDDFNSRPDMSDIDKVLFSTCIIYNLTEEQLDSNPKKAMKMAGKVSEIFKKEFNKQPFEKIGKYLLNYDPGTMRLGQYMELSFYLSGNTLTNAHKAIASISEEKVKGKWVNDSNNHEKKSKFFLSQPVTRIMGSLAKFVESFLEFNKRYSGLFGLDKDTHGEAQGDRFNKIYGWWYAAEALADYKRISLEQAYELNVRDAFSSLGYLKEKQRYQTEQLKQK